MPDGERETVAMMQSNKDLKRLLLLAGPNSFHRQLRRLETNSLPESAAAATCSQNPCNTGIILDQMSHELSTDARSTLIGSYRNH
jgi:hypothetical protein